MQESEWWQLTIKRGRDWKNWMWRWGFKSGKARGKPFLHSQTQFRFGRSLLNGVIVKRIRGATSRLNFRQRRSQRPSKWRRSSGVDNSPQARDILYRGGGENAAQKEEKEGIIEVAMGGFHGGLERSAPPSWCTNPPSWLYCWYTVLKVLSNRPNWWSHGWVLADARGLTLLLCASCLSASLPCYWLSLRVPTNARTDLLATRWLAECSRVHLARRSTLARSSAPMHTHTRKQ